jgi:hypothetical protein
MPQGQAVDVRERQFVVQLKEYFDQEARFRSQLTVSADLWW